jgi:RNA polymerase sigma-70 factor (ECF subfamily)
MIPARRSRTEEHVVAHVEHCPQTARAAAHSHAHANGAGLHDLYLAYGGAIRGRCRRLLGDAAAAEDATHEVFLRAFRHRERAPEGEEIVPWLRRIATNYCLNELRNRSIRARPVPEADESGRDSRHPEESISARNEARQLLASLPDRLRDVAWLTYVDDMEQAETARTLGISRRTVVNRIRELRECARQLAEAV